MDTKYIKELLQKHQAKPSKGLGQNFLINELAFEKILENAELKTADTVLEVGPGIGNLTQKLAAQAKKVIAVEKDETMCEILQETLAGQKNVTVKNEDILQFDLPEENYKVVANIPYYLTSPLIRRLLENKKQPELLVLLIQKEVAQRICAKPGDMSLLAVSVQFYATAKIVANVPKNYFWPAPKIDSAVIKITPKTEMPDVDRDLFFKILHAGFAHPRKQLHGNLSAGLGLSKEKIGEWLKENNIDPKQRAETLSVEDWISLAKSF